MSMSRDTHSEPIYSLPSLAQPARSLFSLFSGNAAIVRLQPLVSFEELLARHENTAPVPSLAVQTETRLLLTYPGWSRQGELSDIRLPTQQHIDLAVQAVRMNDVPLLTVLLNSDSVEFQEWNSATLE